MLDASCDMRAPHWVSSFDNRVIHRSQGHATGQSACLPSIAVVLRMCQNRKCTPTVQVRGVPGYTHCSL